LILLFFVAGVVGTLASIISVPAPYDVGTGASQAVLGLTACGISLTAKGVNNSIRLKLALLLCIVPAMALDIIYAGYPKRGHAVAFVVGLFFSLYHLPKTKATG